MSTGWNRAQQPIACHHIINLLGNEYWLELEVKDKNGVTRL